MWAPAGLALPMGYVAGLVLVVALPGTREKIVAAGTTSLLMILIYFSAASVPGGGFPGAVAAGDCLEGVDHARL